MMNWLLAGPEVIQSWLFERAVQPALFGLGLMRYAEDAYTATGFAVLGLLQVALIAAILRPLEAWVPVERWADRRAVRPDMLYTLLERLGAIPLALFFLLQPWVDRIDATVRLHGWWIPPNLEDLVPGLAARPLLAFLVYLAVLDLSEYARHRLQHRFSWWWALHSVHHSQRQLSFWADDRNHLLDVVIADLWRAAVALAIGVPGGQFVAVVLLSRGLESLAHANVRFGFGRMGDRALVSPSYHRIHHAMGLGHEGPARGCNFASLLPVWDILFRTADFRALFAPTGIADQLDGADYGRGLLSQQWVGLVRLARSLTGSAAMPRVSALRPD